MNADRLNLSRKKQVDQEEKTIGILQPGFLPWIGFFEQVHRADKFILYDDVQFEKGGWRNRNRIKTPHGCQWLTVPVLSKGRGVQLVKDIQINDATAWQKKQIKAIRQNYCKAAYYDRYADELIALLERPWRYLIELDITLIRWIINKMGIDTPLVLSSDTHIPGRGVQRLISLIQTFNGTCFYEGAAGRNYIEEELFQNAGIRLVYQDYQHPVYPQLYGDFISHLSIIDLLFNCGPKSLSIVTNQQNGEVR